jgi:phosphohistidine phosphatase
MKTLALLRHGKSSWEKPELRDFDRPLKRRGREAAALIGAEMRRRGLAFDLVLASPARRVVQTIAHLEKGYCAPLEPRFEPDIYESSSRVLLRILRDIDDGEHRLLLVGHNPGLQGLALSLAAPDDPLCRRVADHFPTAALVLMELPAKRWSEIEPGSGRIVDYLKPRELKGERAGK